MGIDKNQEDKIVAEFRGRVKDLDQEDAIIRRFLRSKNYDLALAEASLRKSVEWRQTHDLDNAANWFISEKVVDSFPLEYPGVDYKNRTIMYIGLGLWPMRPMVESGHGPEMIRYIHVCIEKLVSEIEKTKDEEFTFILDLEGISLWTNAHYETWQVILTVFRDFEAYYCGRLAEALVINAPFIFNYIWPLVRVLLTGNTLSKIKFLGANEGKYLPILLDRMPITSLPKKLRLQAEKKKMGPTKSILK